MQTKKTNIRRLKKFAMNKLPTNSGLRDVILVEKDELSREEFLAKMDIWLNLFKKEIQ